MMNMKSGSLFGHGYVSNVSHHFLQENTWQWVVKIIGATFFYRLSIGCVGKQSIYDFQHKKVSISKNDVSDSVCNRKLII